MRKRSTIFGSERLISLGHSVIQVWKVAFPVLCYMLLNRLMQIIDRIMLSHYSIEALNEATVAMQAVDIFYFPILSVVSISEIFVGQMNGKKKFKETSVPIFQTIVFLVCIWVIFFPILVCYAPVIIPDNLHKNGCLFFLVQIAIIPIHIIFLSLSAFFIGIKQPKVILPAVFISNPLNIVLDVIFVFGWLGVPAMGVLGIAIASSISITTSAGILLYFFINSNNAKKYGTCSINFNIPLFWKQIKIGIPNLFSEFVEVVSFFLMTTMLSKISQENLTIHNIVLTLWTFFAFIIKGFQKGIITLASNYLGGKNEKAIEQLIESMLVVAVFCSIVLYFPLRVFGKQIITIGFNIKDACFLEKIGDTLFILWISITFCIVTSSCLAGILVAGGDTGFMTHVRVSSTLLGVSINYCLFLLKQLDVNLLWSVIAFQLFFNGIFYYYRYESKKWKHIL